MKTAVGFADEEIAVAERGEDGSRRARIAGRGNRCNGLLFLGESLTVSSAFDVGREIRGRAAAHVRSTISRADQQ